MASEPISATYFINPSHQSVCLYVYPLIVARQRFGKHVPVTTNTPNNRRIVGGIFYAVRVVSKESLLVSVFPSTGVRQCLGKHIPAATKNCWRRRFLCGPCRIKRESVGLPVFFLNGVANGSVNTFPRQRRIVGGVVFCAVRLVSKESRRLVLSRTSCWYPTSYPDDSEVSPVEKRRTQFHDYISYIEFPKAEHIFVRKYETSLNYCLFKTCGIVSWHHAKILL
jgi:hypothetical protein